MSDRERWTWSLAWSTVLFAVALLGALSAGGLQRVLMSVLAFLGGFMAIRAWERMRNA